MAFRKIKAGLVNADVEQFIGEIGNLFFDITDGTLRLSDGITPGGIAVSGGSGSGTSYTLPTASTTVKGGVKIDGTTITINNQVISGFSGHYHDLSGAPSIPTKVSDLTNDSGYITDNVTTLSSLTSVGTLSSLAISNPTPGIALSISAEPFLPFGTQTWTFRTGTGIGAPTSWIGFPDGTNQFTAWTGNADTVTNGVYTTDTGTVTNTMLAGSIANNKLANSSITVNGSTISLGGSATITAANPNALTIGTGLSGTSYTGSAAVTIAIDSTVATLTGAQILTNKTISGSSNTITNIANSSLSNSSITIGNTAISLGSSSSTLSGVAWITFAGSTSGTTQLRPSAIAGTTTVTMPGTTGTLITTGDTGTVTNAMLAGSIANSKLANSSVTVNGTSISLGSSATITVNSISASGFTSVLGFDAAGSLILSNTNKFRSPSGLTIETGTSPLKDWTFSTTGTLTFPDATVQATAYTGNAATVTNGVYTTDTGTVTNTMLAGSIANVKLANSSVTVNGTSISLGASATVTAAAGTLTGTTLNSTVVSSSLTSVGTLTSLTSSGTVTINNAGVLAYGSGQLYINGATYSRIDFGEIYADPVVNGRSTGSRLIFNPGTGLGRMDSGIGMSTTTLWNSVQDPTFGFGWYAGDGLAGGSGAPVTLLTLSGAGVLTVPGGASVTNNSATNKNLSIGTHGQLFDDGNLHIHTSSGTLWINSLDSSDISIGTQYNSGTGSSVNIGKNLVANSGSVTANATTAFIAGSNAASGVALQMPSEAALRNLTNGSTNMYFDVSIGGSTQGQFQFRSSSSYTNVATMSSTAVSFNTSATVTARTPSLARTAFNVAIDTELTVNDLRFRISNQGGIFPQVISNTGGSKNLAWTGVGACSGAAVAQVGSTGTIVAHNAWTTLYNNHGMDSAGDTVTVTLQDKAGGAIYRITFMRSDNGSTTGYNIIGERLI